MTLIRHASFAGAFSIGPLPQSVRLLACFRTLVARIRRTCLPAASSLAASATAVALTPVATDTNKEHRATILATAPAHSQSIALGYRLFLNMDHANTISQTSEGGRMIAPAGADDTKQLYIGNWSKKYVS